MADTTDTPPADTAAPTSRRRGPRKGTTPGTRRAPRKTAVEKAETAVADAVGTVAKRGRRAVAQAEGAVTAAAAETGKRVRRGVASAEGSVASTVKAVKPRSSSRGKPQPARKKAAGKGGKGGLWGKAAIAGGIAAAGVAAAALFGLKGSSKAGDPAPLEPTDGARQSDGTDATKSFEAKIADENTVPN